MILKLFLLRDKVSENFHSPVLEEKAEVAKRNFAYAVNNSPNLAFMSKDLEMYAVAELDSKTGVITPITPMEFVCRADSLISFDSKEVVN